MALKTKAGSFSLVTSLGNQSITGLGFQPEIVLFLGSLTTADAGPTGDFHMAFGAATSSSDRRTINANSRGPSVQVVDAIRACRNVLCLTSYQIGYVNDIDYMLNFVSMDADGFTIAPNWKAPTAAYLIGYLALGGNDISNATTGQFTSAVSTGNQSVTGVGFQPDALILFGTAEDTNFETAANDGAYFIVGFTDGTNQGQTSIYTKNASDPTDTSRNITSSKVYSALTNNQGILQECSIVSMDADGFTVNWTTANGTARYLGYIAIKGNLRVAVGNTALSGSTGNQSVSGVGFKPNAAMFQINGHTVEGVTTHGEIGLSFCTDSSSRFEIGGNDRDALNVGLGTVVEAYRHTQSGKIIANYAAGSGGSGGALQDLGDFVSWDADGFTYNMSTASNALKMNYLVFGSGMMGQTLSTNRGFW